jgi:hypothetical protein
MPTRKDSKESASSKGRSLPACSSVFENYQFSEKNQSDRLRYEIIKCILESYTSLVACSILFGGKDGF